MTTKKTTALRQRMIEDLQLAVPRDWATLLKLRVPRCTECNGPLRIVAVIPRRAPQVFDSSERHASRATTPGPSIFDSRATRHATVARGGPKCSEKSPGESVTATAVGRRRPANLPRQPWQAQLVTSLPPQLKAARHVATDHSPDHAAPHTRPRAS